MDTMDIPNHVRSFFVLDEVDKFNNNPTREQLHQMAALRENDLAPSILDLKSERERLLKEMEPKTEDYTALFQEIVKANKEVAISQMGFHISEDDILRGLTGDVFKLSPFKTCQVVTGKVELSRKRGDKDISNHDELPIKRIKEEHIIQHVSESEMESQPEEQLPNTPVQFVCVNEVATNQKKFIMLNKGQDVPEGFEIASIRGTVPRLPEELALIGPTNLQSLITSTSELELPKLQPPSESVPTTSNENQDASKKKLKPLSELMTVETEKKTRILKYKQRSSISPTKLASLLNSSTNKQGSATPLPVLAPNSEATLYKSRCVQIEKPQPPAVVINSNSSLKPNSDSTNTRSIGIGTGTALDSILSPAIAPSAKPSLSVTPLGMGPTALLGCKICGEVFPCHNDHNFRKHMFVKHQVEIINDKYFEDSKVLSGRLLRCKKCKVIVLNKCEEHQIRCLPSISKEEAFEEISLSTFSWPHKVTHMCGIRDCTNSFGTRYQLNNHIKRQHADVASKIIVDPEFRCSKCWKRFDDSYALGKHCTTCTNTAPQKEDILELAKSLLYCDFCGKKHPGLGDTTSCYLLKTIFRCVLCLAMFREKPTFFMHLHTYHGLRTTSQPSKLLIDCPICNFGPDKYTVTFPHIVTEHFTPILAASNQTTSSQQTPTNTTAVQQQQNGEEPEIPVIPGSAMSTVVANLLPPRRLPELRPLGVNPTVSNSPGIIINTNRLTPSISVAPGQIGQPRVFSNARTSSSQIFTQNRFVFLQTSSASNLNAPYNVKDHGDTLVSVPRTVLLKSATSPSTSNDGNLSVKQPMSGMSGVFKIGSPATTRQPQIGLVRPLTTMSLPTHFKPVVTSSATQLLRSTALSTISIIPSSSPIPMLTAGSRPTITRTAMERTPVITKSSLTSNTPLSAIVPSATSTADNIRVSTSTETPPRILLQTSTNVRMPAVSSVPAISSRTTPVVHTLGPTTTIDTPNISSAVGPPVVVTSKHDSGTAANGVIGTVFKSSSTSKTGSRIVTIGGRTYEYQVIQSKLTNKDAGKKGPTPISTTPNLSISHTQTQSRSGLTVARHPPAPAVFRVPFIPTPTVRAPVSSATACTQQPKDSQPPSQNSTSN